MRNDMSKVVNQGGESRKIRPYVGRKVECIKDAEGYMPIESGRVRMRDRRIGWGDEKSNVTYKPIRRWLAAQVGRPWDSVYAELSARYLPRMGESLRSWVNGEVSQDCWRNNANELVFNSTFAGVRDVGFNDFYVDPVTRLLCASARACSRSLWAERQAQIENERAKVFRQGPGNLQYHKRDGVWFEVTMASLSQEISRLERVKLANPEFPVRSMVFDSFEKRRRSAPLSYQAANRKNDLYAKSHRTLSSRECSRLNLD